MSRTYIKAIYIDPDVCFECGAPATERHHVVPALLGGTKTIPLCGICHAKVHDISGKRRNQLGELTKKALKQRQELIKTQGGFYSKSGQWRTSLGGGNSTEKAIIQSAKNRVARAKANPINVFFWQYVTNFEKRNGKLDPKDSASYQKLADELNELGQTTMTGLPYTKTRCQALVIKMRKRFKGMTIE